MRRLLISAAVLVTAAASAAMAQPNDPSQIRGKGGFGQYEQRQAQGGNGGPTTFTNQMPQGQQPDQGQNRDRGGDRGGRGPQQQVAPQPQPQQPQAQQQDRRGDNRGDRGDNRGDRGDRGNWQNRDNRGPGFDNRPGFDDRRGFDNRRGFNDRGRNDWRSYGNYHRNFQPSRRFRAPDYRRPQGFYARRWTFGEFLPSLFWGQRSYWLDYRMYDLPAPPPGAVWVRVDDDALLIDQYSGEIITVSYGVFY